MKIIRQSSSPEVVLAWLRAELSTGRSKDSDAKQTIKEEIASALARHGVDVTLIANADLQNEEDNLSRLAVLQTYRDWMQDDLDTYDWQLVALSADDVRKLHYIDYSYWNELSKNTHEVGVGADNVRNGAIIFDVPNDTFWSIAKAFEAGKTFEPIIVFKENDDDPGRIIEGHARSTGYLLATDLEQSLMAIIGIKRV